MRVLHSNLHFNAMLLAKAYVVRCCLKDACELAERLKIKKLLLYHTEDQTLANRKELYKAEGDRYFNGFLWIPDDLESIKL